MPDDAPILPYATPGDDGVPDVYAPVEAMIDRRCRPKDIRVHFRKSAHAAAYFARSVSRRFSIEKLGHVCDVCGGVCDTFAAMTWSVEIPRKKMELSLDASPKEHFDTQHAVCEPCHRVWKRRMKMLNLSRLVACLAIAAGMIWLLVVRKWYAGKSLTIVLMPCVLMIAGVAVLLGANWIARFATPRLIRRKLPPGLSPSWLGGLADRKEAATWANQSIPNL